MYTVTSWYELDSGYHYGRSVVTLWTDERNDCRVFVGAITVHISRKDAARVLWAARKGQHPNGLHTTVKKDRVRYSN